MFNWLKKIFTKVFNKKAAPSEASKFSLFKLAPKCATCPNKRAYAPSKGGWFCSQKYIRTKKGYWQWASICGMPRVKRAPTWCPRKGNDLCQR